jgi:hypothetical protein
MSSHERGLLLNHLATRFRQRHAKFHPVAASRVTHDSSAQPRGIQIHEKPLGAIHDEELGSRSPANQVRTGIPADLEPALAVERAQLD